MNITIIGEWGAYPEAESATSSLLIEEDDFHLLIDCGSGVISQLQKYIPIHKLDALILTHYHNDHIADIGCLQYALMIQGHLGTYSKTLPIYSHTKDTRFQTLTYEKATKGIAIDRATYIELGPFKVEFGPTIHPVYNLSVKVSSNGKTLVYTSDTEWCDELVEFANGVDLLISESNLYNEQLGKIKGHLTASQAGRLGREAQVKKLILTHLPHHGEVHLLKSEAEEVFRGEVLLAKKGHRITI